MQTIFKTAPASNFAIFANDLVNTPMPFKAKEVLFYLLAKPKDWRVKVADIRNNLALTTHTIRKSLEWLQQAGYAGYVRLKTGHTIWKIFDKPQMSHQTKTAYSPRVMPQTVMPYMAKPDVLQITETETKKETTTPIPTETIINPDTIAPVVVPLEEEKLVFPETFTESQTKDAKRILKKLIKPELSQVILLALAEVLTKKILKTTIPRYLGWAVNLSNEQGYFEFTQAAGASNKGGKPHIPIWQGFGQSTPSSQEKAKGFLQQAKLAARGAL